MIELISSNPDRNSFKVLHASLGAGQARANVNIALIKYWGKSSATTNQPAVGSLSLTLDEWGSKTKVSWVNHGEVTDHSFFLNGQERSDSKVDRLLDELLLLAERYGHRWAGVGQAWAVVESQNTVPTASGLASSASGMAALGLAAWSALGWQNPLITTSDQRRQEPTRKELIDLVRIGSGSAVRSLLGGVVRLEQDGQTMKQLCTEENWPLALVVCVVDPGPKSISSREGMERTRLTSPYYSAWVESHQADLEAAEKAVDARDLDTLGELMEHSTFKMHSVMWASKPPLRYLKSTSFSVLDGVELLRKQGVSAWATMDAGPHVKVLCLQPDVDVVVDSLSRISGLHSCVVRFPGRAASIIE